MSIMDLFRRNKPPQKTTTSKIKIKDIADARDLKRTVLKEILEDDNYYINGNGHLDKRDAHEVTPFGHLREMRKQPKEDVIGKMMRPLIGREKDKVRLETRLRAIDFIRTNLAEDATITDGYINALHELLFDQYHRGYNFKVKSRTLVKRKHKKK